MGSLKGFANLCRGKLRDPIVKEALVLGIAGGLLRETETSVAVAAAMALQYDTLARPSEVIAIARQLIVGDYRALTGERWVLTFFPATADEVSKTRQQDDTVVIGEVLPWVSQCVPALVQRAQFGKIFLFDLPTYEREMQNKLEAGGVGGVGTPHGNRHGGASLMAVMGAPHQAVQARGRWASDSSVMRYKKHGRFLRCRAALAYATLLRAEKAEAVVARLLPLALAGRPAKTAREQPKRLFSSAGVPPTRPRRRAADSGQMVGKG